MLAWAMPGDWVWRWMGIVADMGIITSMRGCLEPILGLRFWFGKFVLNKQAQAKQIIGADFCQMVKGFRK